MGWFAVRFEGFLAEVISDPIQQRRRRFPGCQTDETTRRNASNNNIETADKQRKIAWKCNRPHPEFQMKIQNVAADWRIQKEEEQRSMCRME